MKKLYPRIILLTLVAMLVFAPAALAVEEGGSPLDALGINMGFLIAQIVNFVLVAVLLTFGLWNPLRNLLDERTAKIQKGIEDAAEAANARKNAEAEAEKILAQARSEAQKVVEEGRKRGDDLAASMRKEAEAESEKIRSDAREAAQQARDVELSSLRGQVASISVALANRLIGEALDDKKQKALISDFFSKVPADAKKLSGEVTVISAMPLEDAEKSKIEKELKVDSVVYKVDPTILGGLVIRGADSVVDGSVRTGLNEISSRLQ